MLYRTRFEHEIASLQYDVPPTGPAPKTYYLPIEFSRGLKGNRVGAHVPVAAAGAKVVDVIVYLHGVIDACRGDLSKFSRKGIEYLWSHSPFDNLRSELDTSGHAAMLLAPQMHEEVGKTWNHNHIGGLNEKNAFDKFIRKCCDELVARKAIRADVKLGNIVLAAHSGGGWPMNEILKARNDLRPKIRACWGFECLNLFQLETWEKWLDSDASLQFWHYREKSTIRDVMKNQARRMRNRKHKNFHDITTATHYAHCSLPQELWKDALGHMP